MTTYLRGSADINAVAAPSTAIATNARHIAHVAHVERSSVARARRAGDLLGVLGDDDPESPEPSLPPSSAQEPDRAKPRGAIARMAEAEPPPTYDAETSPAEIFSSRAAVPPITTAPAAEEGVDAAAMSSNFTSREERRRKEELDEARKVRIARTDATVRATPPPPFPRARPDDEFSRSNGSRGAAPTPR